MKAKVINGLEGYNPATVPAALKVIAGGMADAARRQAANGVKGGDGRMNTMKAYLERRKPGVTHYVRDLRKAAEWYRDMLGFEIGPHEYTTFVEMHSDGEYMFHLTPPSGELVPHRDPVVTFPSLDIEQTHAALLAKGVSADPIQWYPDYSMFTFRDLDGHVMAVNQTFEMRLRELEPMRIVGFKLERAGGIRPDAAIQAKARELRSRLADMPDAGEPFFMIGAYDPAEDAYWVGVRTDAARETPGGMTAVDIPGGRYAVKWHYGKRSETPRTYGRMEELLKQAEIAKSEIGWRIEMTRHWGSKAEDDELEMDLYIPIR